MLRLGTLELLLPQPEVHTLEPVLDLEPAPGGQGPCGWLPLDAVRWPVYCLSAGLEPLAVVPPSRRLCVLLMEAEQAFGLACDAAQTVTAAGLRIEPLPACMHRPHGPVQALALDGERILPVSDTGALAAHLQHRCGSLAGPRVTDAARCATGGGVPR
jgi:hypothetical protein